MHYCIGDIHGCFDEFIRMKNRIEAQDPDAKIILLGDLIDRGPKSYEMLCWALEHVTENGRYQCIMGNHEDLLSEWYRHKFIPWYENDPSHELLPTTKFDFSKMAQRYGLITPDKLKQYIDFVEKLPLRKELDIVTNEGEQKRLVVVHAWYDKKVRIPIVQKKMNLRLRKFTGNENPEYTVIFGHTPTGNPDLLQSAPEGSVPGKIVRFKGAVCIDGGCCFGTDEGYQGNLCGICLETGEEFYEAL